MNITEEKKSEIRQFVKNRGTSLLTGILNILLNKRINIREQDIQNINLSYISDSNDNDFNFKMVFHNNGYLLKTNKDIIIPKIGKTFDSIIVLTGLTSNKICYFENPLGTVIYLKPDFNLPVNIIIDSDIKNTEIKLKIRNIGEECILEKNTVIGEILLNQIPTKIDRPFVYE